MAFLGGLAVAGAGYAVGMVGDAVEAAESTKAGQHGPVLVGGEVFQSSVRAGSGSARIVISETWIGPAGSGPHSGPHRHVIEIVPPLVLDLTGDGIDYRSVVSDRNGDGRFESFAWVGSGDGILVRDANQDGIGTQEEWALTSQISSAATDLQALRAYDSNQDGVFNAGDTQFSLFRIGRDFNQNGRFDFGELQTLSEAGIQQINLSAGITAVSSLNNPFQVSAGTALFDTGQFVRINGSIGSFVDVGFQSTAVTSLVFEDALARVLNLGNRHAFITMALEQPMYLDLSSLSYGGRSGFVDAYGGNANDTIIGSGENNTIYGGSGADVLHGAGGDDLIYVDSLDLQYGSVSGGDGYDTLVFTDTAALNIDAATIGFEQIFSGAGNDYLTNSSANSIVLLGGDGADYIVGGSGDDTLVGGEGYDTLSGGDGSDLLVMRAGDNFAASSGGSSIRRGDTLLIEGDVGVSINSLASMDIEHFVGGRGNDIIYAAAPSSFRTVVVSNTLTGGAGDDFLYGGNGIDRYVWSRGDGNDVVREDADFPWQDEIILGPNISHRDVWISTSISSVTIHIGGSDGGSITVDGFYSGTDRTKMSHNVELLYVNGQYYDLYYLARSPGALPPPNTGTGDSGVEQEAELETEVEEPAVLEANMSRRAFLTLATPSIRAMSISAIVILSSRWTRLCRKSKLLDF